MSICQRWRSSVFTREMPVQSIREGEPGRGGRGGRRATCLEQDRRCESAGGRAVSVSGRDHRDGGANTFINSFCKRFANMVLSLTVLSTGGRGGAEREGEGGRAGGEEGAGGRARWREGGGEGGREGEGAGGREGGRG